MKYFLPIATITTVLLTVFLLPNEQSPKIENEPAPAVLGEEFKETPSPSPTGKNRVVKENFGSFLAPKDLQ